MSDPSGLTRYLVVQGCVGAAIVNALLNGGIGVAVTRGLSTFPLWALPGAAADLVATAFGVAFGTALVVPHQVKKDFARRRLPRPETDSRFVAALSRLPPNLLARAMIFGIASVPVFCPPLFASLLLAGADPLSVPAFVLVKAGFAAAEAALVTPVVILSALYSLPRTA